MADTQNKHSAPRAQGSRRAAHASTKTKAPPKRRSASEPKAKLQKRRTFPRLSQPRIIKRGKTTIHRYHGRQFHRFDDVQGKIVDYAEIYTAGDYHSVDISFQDKTALHFVIDPGFTLDTEYCDWKTGNLRTIKRWPRIRSQTLRA